MKLFRNILTIVLVLGFMGSCDLNKQVDPNEISPEQASLDDLYNRIQLDFRDVYRSSEVGPGAAVRMYHAGAFTYRAWTTPNSFNGLWGNFYNELLPDIEGLMVISEGKNFDIHVGTAKIMKAYAMMMVADVLGDVPYSEALKGIEVISPKTDSSADVYAAALAILDEAIVDLTDPEGPEPAFDNYYGGSAKSWITLANTIKLRAAVNMASGGDAAAVATINSIIAAGDIIDLPEEDFQFQYGSQRNNPNSRNPTYNNMYETADGDYLSNYYMWVLLGDKEDASGNIIIDPRLRYYFYRKVDDARGQDVTVYSCHYSVGFGTDTPAWYTAVDPRMPYCVASSSAIYRDGYYGRDHLNGEGTPPDGPVRTSYGLYPFGGDFDDDSFEDTREQGTTGGLGEGVEPIMLSSYVHFMLAESALVHGTTGDAWTHTEMGIQQSMDKVEGFESLVATKMSTEVTLKDGSTGTIKDLFGMDATAKSDYIADVKAIFDNPTATDPVLNTIIKEYYIAAWGNGLEAYNMYRRTGYPNNLQPGLEEQVGAFPLTFFYPSNAETRNSNISQKGDLDAMMVFWQDATIAAGLK